MISCSICKFAHLQTNEQSPNFMVVRFLLKETEYQSKIQKKVCFIKVLNWFACHGLREVFDPLLPNQNSGSHRLADYSQSISQLQILLTSTYYLYKAHLSTESVYSIPTLDRNLRLSARTLNMVRESVFQWNNNPKDTAMETRVAKEENNNHIKITE